MKLATVANGYKDGTLVVVSRNLKRARRVPWLAATLQTALDRWKELEAGLRQASRELDADLSMPDAFDFHFEQALAPLPRAYAWLDGSAYLSHLERFRKVAGRTVPAEYYATPLMYQGGSDTMLSCRAELACDPEWGADCEAEVAVVIDKVPARPTRQQALDAICLVTIVNDVSLRQLQSRERETGFGWLHCKPPTAFAPVMATPDELGDAWRDGKVHLPLQVWINDWLLGRPDTGVGMQFDFARLIQHAAETRSLAAGTIIGSGTVSNPDADKVGVACIAERRFLEQLKHGEPVTPYLQEGDRVRVEMVDAGGASMFGDIVQVAKQIIR